MNISNPKIMINITGVDYEILLPEEKISAAASAYVKKYGGISEPMDENIEAEAAKELTALIEKGAVAKIFSGEKPWLAALTRLSRMIQEYVRAATDEYILTVYGRITQKAKIEKTRGCAAPCLLCGLFPVAHYCKMPLISLRDGNINKIPYLRKKTRY